MELFRLRTTMLLTTWYTFYKRLFKLLILLQAGSMMPDTDSDGKFQDPSPESSSCSSSDDDDQVQYAYSPTILSRVHRGLLRTMPRPAWYLICDITDECSFTIDLGSKDKRNADQPCMEPLTSKEKAYLRDTVWGLYNKRFVRIWKKMCQTHWDSHWREAGLVVDHARKRVYRVEEEADIQTPDDG
jgi:hypothetical protein